MSNFTTLAADGSTGAVRCTSTLYLIEADDDFGGGTLTPQIKSNSGNWITYGDTTFTASGAAVLQVPKGKEIRATLSGATSPDLKVHFSAIE